MAGSPDNARRVCRGAADVAGAVDLQKGPHAVSHPVIIAGIEDKALVERHFTWLPAGREYILRDIWGMLGHLPDPALRQFYHMCVGRRWGSWRRSSRPGPATVTTTIMSAGYLNTAMRSPRPPPPSACSTRSALVSTCVAFVGGLLHDIGKIHLYYNAEDGEGICGQHESYNFLVLARQMEALRMAALRLFEAPSSCLSIKIGGRVGRLPAGQHGAHVRPPVR